MHRVIGDRSGPPDRIAQCNRLAARGHTDFRHALLAPAAVAVLILGCHPPERPPIVIVSIDTLRSDRLPAYGYDGGSTPAIDAVTRDGVLFERAFAQAPMTLPSHVSLLTGEIPPRHGVRDNIGFPVQPGRALLLQQRLRDLGYTTGAAISAQVLGSRTGFATGFDFFAEHLDPSSSQGAATLVAERPGGEALEAAEHWLASVGDRPFFLLLHLYEPHAPYRPPEPFSSRFSDPYDGEIAAADDLAGRLFATLRRLGLYERSIVFLLSDHGEGLGDHGEDEHGLLLYREALQVPLILKLPGQRRAGERIRRNVGLIDVVPTILELLDQEPAQPLAGRSLLATAAPDDRPIYSETMYPLLHFSWSDLASVVAGDLHLIEGPRPELYDLVGDPGEASDQVSADRRSTRALREVLAGIDRSIEPPQPADEKTLAALGALGYLGQVALPGDRRNLPNPRDQVALVAPVLHGVRLFQEGKYEQAVSVLNEAVSSGLSVPHAWQYLGAAYEALGRKTEAADAYRESARIAGATSDQAQLAARRLLELGRPEAALELLNGELARNPDSAGLQVLASRALLQLGRMAEAEQAADAAVGRDQGMADAWYQRAVVAIARRDAVRAQEDLERAAGLDARNVEARKALAMLHFGQGDHAAAKRLLEEVLAIDPDDADARQDLERLAAVPPTE